MCIIKGIGNQVLVMLDFTHERGDSYLLVDLIDVHNPITWGILISWGPGKERNMVGLKSLGLRKKSCKWYQCSLRKLM